MHWSVVVSARCYITLTDMNHRRSNEELQKAHAEYGRHQQLLSPRQLQFPDSRHGQDQDREIGDHIVNSGS